MFSLMGLLASIHAVIFYGLRTPRRVADKPVIANYRRVYRAPPRPIQRAFDVMHRPMDYGERATSMRWKNFYSCCDAVIAIELSGSTARARRYFFAPEETFRH